MNDKKKKYLKIFIVVLILGLFVWFLILYPLLTFKKNENTMKKAAERYYELNMSKLPTGNRISTVTLQTLARESYVKEDFYIPLTNKVCSLKNSWVKVKHTSSGYKYYPYLECGAFKSAADHKGPVIMLNGDSKITLDKDVKYEDLGVKKVVDDTDGVIDNKKVVVESNVDTSKVGKYKVKYSVSDSFGNMTTEVRDVEVIQKLRQTVLKDTKKDKIYKGFPENNYIRFSGILYRILGVSDDGVRIVTDRDISNVNYSGIDSWLGYYYDHIADSSKKYLVKSSFCEDSVDDKDVESVKTCKNYSKNKYVGLLSIQDINNSLDKKDSYLYGNTIAWLSNVNPKKEQWAFRLFFMGISKKYMAFPNEYNFGIRPVLTLKNDSIIKGGIGTEDNPYVLDDMEPVKAGKYLNTGNSGEYITYSNVLWRIIDVMEDGTVKAITEDTLPAGSIRYDDSGSVKVYNPKKKGNVGYTINQRTSDVIKEDYFVEEEIEVPIYNNIALYKKEDKTEKYKVKFHAPDTYDLFSAISGDFKQGYWLMNSSLKAYMKYLISAGSVVYYSETDNNIAAGIRPVGYFNKKCKVSNGIGTKENPYVIVK